MLLKLSERIAMCLEKAAEAERMAKKMSLPDARKSYLELAKNWHVLARTYERAEALSLSSQVEPRKVIHIKRRREAVVSIVIGEVLKATRLKLGMSADDVAALCNVSRSRVYMWEASSYVFPKNISTLSTVLGIPEKKLHEINGQPE